MCASLHGATRRFVRAQRVLFRAVCGAIARKYIERRRVFCYNEARLWEEREYFMLDYLTLAFSTLFATGKALFCKALGTGRYSKKEVAVLNFKSFFVAFLCSLLFVAGEMGRWIHTEQIADTMEYLYRHL